MNQAIEMFCCPGASASKKRGACSLENEMKGNCCWQRPCGFPALNVEISGDGNSIVFQGDIDHVGSGWSIDGRAGFEHTGGMKTGEVFIDTSAMNITWIAAERTVDLPIRFHDGCINPRGHGRGRGCYGKQGSGDIPLLRAHWHLHPYHQVRPFTCCCTCPPACCHLSALLKSAPSRLLLVWTCLNNILTVQHKDEP